MVWAILADLRRVRRTMQPTKKNPESLLTQRSSLTTCYSRREYARKMAFRSNKVLWAGRCHILFSPRLTSSSDTLIVWTEPSNSVDMALSFQEAEGCAVIWLVLRLLLPRRRGANEWNRKFVHNVQQQLLAIAGPGMWLLSLFSSWSGP